MAGLAYIVNVVINEHKQTVAAFAGDFEQAHEAGVRFLRQYCQTTAIPGDIIVTTNGGAPLDQNLYQCVKGLTAAEAIAKLGATIIMCAEMADGVGGSQFYRDMCSCASPRATVLPVLADTAGRNAPQSVADTDSLPHSNAVPRDFCYKTANAAETLTAASRTLFAELQRRNSDGRQGIQWQRLASKACGIG